MNLEKIIIKKEANQKLKSFVSLAKGEISGMAKTSKDGNIVFIEDFIFGIGHCDYSGLLIGGVKIIYTLYLRTSARIF